MKVKFTNDGPAESLEFAGLPVSGSKAEGYTAEDVHLYSLGYRWMAGGEVWRGDPASSCLARPRTDATPILSVVAPDATTEPVSNPYKFEWEQRGNAHILLSHGKQVGEIEPPDEYFRYYWRGGLTWGFRNSLADAMWEVKRAVEADAKAAAENVAQR